MTQSQFEKLCEKLAHKVKAYRTIGRAIHRAADNIPPESGKAFYDGLGRLDDSVTGDLYACQSRLTESVDAKSFRHNFTTLSLAYNGQLPNGWDSV
jgi:hypothetical protein